MYRLVLHAAIAGRPERHIHILAAAFNIGSTSTLYHDSLETEMRTRKQDLALLLLPHAGRISAVRRWPLLAAAKDWENEVSARLRLFRISDH